MTSLIVHQEFAMKQKPQKDVFGIVSFDLIGLLPTNHIICIIYNGIPEFYEETFDVNSYPLAYKIQIHPATGSHFSTTGLFIQDNSKDLAVGNFICLRTYLFVRP